MPPWSEVRDCILRDGCDSPCESLAAAAVEGPSAESWVLALQEAPDLPRCWVLLARRIAANEISFQSGESGSDMPIWQQAVLWACRVDSAALVRALLSRRPEQWSLELDMRTCTKEAAEVRHQDMPDTWTFAKQASYETAWEAIVDVMNMPDFWDDESMCPRSVEVLRAMLRRSESAAMVQRLGWSYKTYLGALEANDSAIVRTLLDEPIVHGHLDACYRSHVGALDMATFSVNMWKLHVANFGIDGFFQLYETRTFHTRRVKPQEYVALSTVIAPHIQPHHLHVLLVTIETMYPLLTSSLLKECVRRIEAGASDEDEQLAAQLHLTLQDAAPAVMDQFWRAFVCEADTDDDAMMLSFICHNTTAETLLPLHVLFAWSIQANASVLSHRLQEAAEAGRLLPVLDLMRGALEKNRWVDPWVSAFADMSNITIPGIVQAMCREIAANNQLMTLSFFRWVGDNNCLRHVPVELAGMFWERCASAEDVRGLDAGGLGAPTVAAALDMLSHKCLDTRENEPGAAQREFADAICDLMIQTGAADAVSQPVRHVLLIKLASPTPPTKCAARALELVMTRFGWRFTNQFAGMRASLPAASEKHRLVRHVIDALEKINALDRQQQQDGQPIKRTKLE